VEIVQREGGKPSRVLLFGEVRVLNRPHPSPEYRHRVLLLQFRSGLKNTSYIMKSYILWNGYIGQNCGIRLENESVFAGNSLGFLEDADFYGSAPDVYCESLIKSLDVFLRSARSKGKLSANTFQVKFTIFGIPPGTP